MTSDYSPRSIHTGGALAASTFGDPAFEPQSGFNFDETHEEETRNMHRNIAAMHGHSLRNQQYFNPINTSSFGPDDLSSFPGSSLPGDNAMYAQTLVNPASVWQTASPPAEGFGLVAPSAQSQIVQNRSGRVSQHFGQITPPDDSTPDDFPSTKRRSRESSTSQAAAQTKTDKSERARNAAIQRHAKTKKLRKDSNQDHVSEHSGDDGTEDKKERYREKNRLAAAKCRAKKKTNIETIEDRHRNLQMMNTAMKKQVQSLRLELTTLRTHALYHQSCHCEIHQYNLNQAKRVAQGADMIGSPSDSVMLNSASSPSSAGPGRTQSLSDAVTPSPGLGSMSVARHDSFAGPPTYPFAPVSTPDDMMSVHAVQDGVDQFPDFLHCSFGAHAAYS